MASPHTEVAKNPSSLAIDANELVTVQSRMGWHERKAFAPNFALRVNQFAGLLGADLPDAAPGAGFAKALGDIGYARLGRVLPPGAVKDVLAYFAGRRCYNAHVAAQSDGIGASADELANWAHFGSYRPEDVIAAPHILELANDSTILSAVGAYLGCVPSLYSMNAWWSFPRPEKGGVITQSFHRDGDDFKNCVLFLYLTDTDGDGCHQYIRHSHDPAQLIRESGIKDGFTVGQSNGETLNVAAGLDELFEGAGYDRDDVYRTLFGDLVDSIEGVAGEGFLTDPDGLHRAKHPEAKRRLIVWLRYGMHRNGAYVRDLLQPVARLAVAGRLPETATARFINRLVVSPE